MWWWDPQPASANWQWSRVYHQGEHTPDGVTFRRYGPLSRLDHHHAAERPAVDTTGRRILYVGEDLGTSASEVFGEAGIARICPGWRVAIVTPTRRLAMFDLARNGAAMAIGALPALAQGNEKRSLTQDWARAIYEDQPAGTDVTGVHYRSAYSDGQALASWDCDGDIAVMRDGRGRPQDLPLNDPRVLLRLQVHMGRRRIGVTTVPASSCSRCTPGA